MNFLKKFLGTSPTDEIAVLPSGKLFLARSPSSPKGEVECLYNDAIASIRETTAAHHYQLIIQKAYAEGEEKIKDDDDSDEDDDLNELSGSKDEWTFLIDEHLKLCQYSKSDGSIVISWKDLNGDAGDKFEFVVDESVKLDNIRSFMNSSYKCEYERKYKKSSINATEAELKEFKFDAQDELINDILYGDKNLQSESEDDFEDAKDLSPKKYTQPSPMTREEKSAPIPETPKGEQIFSTVAELHLFDAGTGSFIQQNTKANIVLLDLSKWEYWMSIKTDNGIELGCAVWQDMNPTFNYEYLSFVFNYYAAGNGFSWLLKFQNFDELNTFQENYMRCLWESLNCSKWGKLKDDHDYVLGSFNQLSLSDEVLDDIKELSDDDDYESQDDEEFAKVNNLRKGIHKENFSDSEDENDVSKGKYYKGKEKNSHLAVGFKNDRSFVARGNKIGVFKSSEDDNLEFHAAIENLQTLDGKKIDPHKIMLHMEDRAMILQNKNDASNLYKMDLEYGKVVEEWKIHDDIPVVEIGPTQKFSQLTGEQTLLGISKNGLFKIDPRLQGNKLVESELKSYVSKNDFSSIATTESGFIAVASNKGDIRLYDRLGINAKTQLPALGEAIIGLDLSADGRWILATCKTYLLLIDAKIKDGKNAGELGFKKSFGKDSKPRPRRLQISPEHVAFMQTETGGILNFTVAHFNAGLNSKEQTIVTSSGPYVISWSLKKILKGDKDSYMIKRYEQNVMADNFRFGSDKNVILALQNDVAMVNKKSFKKATRESLAPPSFKKSSRNNIINTYD